ncbi:MAG: YkgJ family cysteine cluster protein [Synergistaceae bacterium]|nr:YkgJ family cysteine cluster protein [Synergistaceae bacterium]
MKRPDGEPHHIWWEETGLCFECQECGRCCAEEPGAVWVDEREASDIAGFLGIDGEELRKKYLTRIMGRTTLRELENFDCVFLDGETRKCRIYKVRPRQCRTFPFWPSLLEDADLWKYYSKRCPGMDTGRSYTPEMLRKMYELNSERENDK